MDKFKILVKTGDQERAGTDANVKVVLEDDYGIKCPPLKLDLPLYNDLERGTLDSYNLTIPPTFNIVKKLYITRDSKGHRDDWFCDYIIVQDPRGCETKTHRKIKKSKHPHIVQSCHRGFPAEIYFPICRWVKAEHFYVFHDFATCLPQLDPTEHIRKADLDDKRRNYYYIQNISEGPSQVSN